MPDYDIDPGFERRLEQRLRGYAEQGVRPFDAVEIAHRAATGPETATWASPAGWRGMLPAPVMGVLLTAVLLVGLTATAFAAGWLRLPTPVDPSPPPSPITSPAPTEPPVTDSPTPPPPPTGEPTLTPEPSPPPAETPSPEPSPTAVPTISPSPAPAMLGEWRRTNGLPPVDGFARVRAVTAAGPGFVAVGFEGDGAGNIHRGIAWTSADGITWVAQPSDALDGARLEIVVQHQGMLYALGPILTDDEDRPEMGAYNIWRSADGSDWELLPQPAAFTGDAILQGATSAGESLVAFGYRNPAGATSSVPGIWSWTPGAGDDWQPAETLPRTFDVVRMTYGSGLLLALGNADTERAPWRTLWVSSDGARNWQQAAAPLVSETEDVAAIPGSLTAVGWQSRARDDVVPGAVASGDGASWSVSELPDFPMHTMERVVAIPGHFLALGTEVRFEIDPNCAPAPCEDLVPLGSRAWTSTNGLDWTPAANPPDAIFWTFAALAVGDAGVVVFGNDVDFNDGAWFAPLARPLP